MVDATPLLAGLSPVQSKAIVARFDGGRLYSEGGLLALREIERQLGVADRWRGVSRTRARRSGLGTAWPRSSASAC
jgi:hypothetical protein